MQRIDKGGLQVDEILSYWNVPPSPLNTSCEGR